MWHYKKWLCNLFFFLVLGKVCSRSCQKHVKVNQGQSLKSNKVMRMTNIDSIVILFPVHKLMAVQIRLSLLCFRILMGTPLCYSIFLVSMWGDTKWKRKLQGILVTWEKRELTVVIHDWLIMISHVISW